MLDAKQLSKNIRSLRLQRGITQTRLAQLLNISPQSVSKWESGVSAPDIENLCHLAQALDTTADALLSGAPGPSLLLGIDGGGSKTEFVLFTPGGELVDRLVLGPCNPNATSVAESAQLLRSGIDALTAIHGPVRAVYVGASGFLTGDNGKKVRSALAAAYPGARISCQTDIMNVIAAADAGENCVAAICGTGSVAFVKEGEKLTRLGGWGYLLSPGGSGYDIGRDVLQAALAHEEGQGSATALTALVSRRLGGPVSECIRQVYVHDQSYIAAFAPLAFEAYEAGDAVAGALLQRNAQCFARLVADAVARCSGSEQVILSGGLLTGNEVYLSMVRACLGQGVQVQLPRLPQVLGACRSCARLCGLDPSKFHKRLLAQYQERVKQC